MTSEYSCPGHQNGLCLLNKRIPVPDRKFASIARSACLVDTARSLKNFRSELKRCQDEPCNCCYSLHGNPVPEILGELRAIQGKFEAEKQSVLSCTVLYPDRPDGLIYKEPKQAPVRLDHTLGAAIKSAQAWLSHLIGGKPIRKQAHVALSDAFSAALKFVLVRLSNLFGGKSVIMRSDDILQRMPEVEKRILNELFRLQKDVLADTGLKAVLADIWLPKNENPQ